MMQSVFLYGLGNIGFRHLQGLVPLRSRVSLIGIDPSPEGRRRAAAEWPGEGLFLHPSRAPSTHAEVVILATPADTRLDLLRNVVNHHHPGHVILEKVVFQSADAFKAAEHLLDDGGVRAWVNCPRRQWPLHMFIRDELKHRGSFKIEFKGIGWGPACNGIHLIDLLQFYSGESKVNVLSSDVLRVVPSKRAGFSEVEGTFSFGTRMGMLNFSCVPSDPERPVMSISGNGWQWRIDESAGVVTDELTGDRLIEAGRAPYQGELTADAVSPLLDGGGVSPLASLAVSREAHIPFLAALASAFEVAGYDLSRGLPIT